MGGPRCFTEIQVFAAACKLHWQKLRHQLLHTRLHFNTTNTEDSNETHCLMSKKKCGGKCLRSLTNMLHYYAPYCFQILSDDANFVRHFCFFCVREREVRTCICLWVRVCVCFFCFLFFWGGDFALQLLHFETEQKSWLIQPN